MIFSAWVLLARVTGYNLQKDSFKAARPPVFTLGANREVSSTPRCVVVGAVGDGHYPVQDPSCTKQGKIGGVQGRLYSIGYNWFSWIPCCSPLLSLLNLKSLNIEQFCKGFPKGRSAMKVIHLRMVESPIKLNLLPLQERSLEKAP